MMLIPLIAVKTSAQIKISYIFRDGCNDSLFSTEYGLLQPSNSKNYASNGKDLTIDSSGSYIFAVDFMRNKENVRFVTIKFYETGKNYKDTIYLPKLIEEGGSLGDNKIVYCLCSAEANGKIKDYYPNGIVRMEGNFLHGIPNSNIKFYNVNGKLIRIMIFRSGQYIKSKFYRRRDHSESF